MAVERGAVAAGARRPLVLCYHAVSSSLASSLAVPEALLSDHVDYLVRRGYVGLTFGEAERRRQDDVLPRRTVVVTFDDGFASVSRAKPILDAAGFPATVFAVTRFVDGAEDMWWPEIAPLAHEGNGELRSLSWAELGSLAADGWEVGSHTVTHPWLTRLDDATLAAELERSRDAIRDRLGACTSVAYPFGAADARVARAARAAGYTAGCTLTRTHALDEPLRRPRVGLYPNDSGTRRVLKLSTTLNGLRHVAGRVQGAPVPRRAARKEGRQAVLVANAEGLSGLATARSLRDGGYEPWVAVTSRKAYAAWSSSVAGVVRVPNPGADPEAFVSTLAAKAGFVDAAAVLPGDELALLALAGRSADFPPETRLGVPAGDVVRRAIDKRTLVDVARKASLATPPTIVVREGDDAGEVSFPAIVKPVRSEVPTLDGARRHETARVVEDRASLDAAVRSLGVAVVQPLVVGRLTAVPVLAWEGELLAAGYQSASRIWPRPCGTTAFAVTGPLDPELRRAAEIVVAELEWSGILQLQFLEDADRRHLIDINPRPYRSLLLATSAGLNLPAAWTDLLLGRPPRIGAWEVGRAFRAEDLDVRAVLADIREDGALRSLVPRRKTTHAIATLRDPAPAVAALAKLGTWGAARVRRPPAPSAAEPVAE